MPRPSKTDPRMRYITRMPDNAWRVWITYGDDDFGQVYFSDREHGSKSAALAAAQGYRNAVIAENEIPLRVYDGNGYYVQHSRNTSGMIGVMLCADNPDKPTRVNWTTTIMRDGKETRRAFSIRKHGYRNAYQMAASVRAKHTGQPIPSVPVPPPWLATWAESYGVNLDEM